MERYRRQGERAFPTSYPETFYDRPVKSTRGPDIFPLGTVSNVVSVFCKEAGELMVYKTDRHGFHNEDSVWDAESKPIVLIGDSFTTGACVASENNIAATLQGLTGEKVLNLGVAGGGPLAYLAVIREYLPGLKLRDVYWIHFEANDLMNVVDEMKNPILRRYTDSEFSQNLKRRQDEIDEGLEIFLNDSYREFGMRIEKDENVSISETLIDSERRAAFFKKYITDVLLLRNTRFLVQTIVGTRFLTAQTNNAEWMYPVANPLPAGGTMTAVDAEKYCGNPSFGLFKDAFDRGLKEVSTLGAKLNFVYIHDVHSGLEGRLDNLQYLCVRQFVESKETLFIDFTDSLIPPDRSRVLYAYPKGGHFSERGYEMAGHTIARSMGSLIHKKPE
ncbi:MAG: hypothetical protein HN360_01450 [Rhodospirillaceae bacterium]|nr:hypothetical protein [Rhodospirillaceae bacterium]